MQQDYLKGRGAQFNTHNRFSQTDYVEEHTEGVEEDRQLPQRQLI